MRRSLAVAKLTGYVLGALSVMTILAFWGVGVVRAGW